MPQTLASLLISAKDLESYIPALDPRRLGKSAVIRGRNFLLDVDGPRSAFGTEFANFYEFGADSRFNVHEFDVNGRWFYGTPTGIWEINPISLNPVLLLPVAIPALFQYWPWSFAKVGNLFYFAQHDIGLWQYDDVSKEWVEIETPDDVNFVCEAYGRLVCLGASAVFWSALDDGTDFTPSVVTGAGAQALSLLSKTAFRVDKISDGVLVTTDKGWLKGEKVAANYVFRWYVSSTDVRAFSPNMTTHIPDVGMVCLDRSGFHITANGKADPWELLQGEYFKNAYIERMDNNKHGCALLYYSQASRMLFVALTPNAREGTFQVTHTYYVPSGKWGVMNHQHRGLFEVTHKQLGNDAAAYMDVTGYMQMLNDNRSKECFDLEAFSLLDFLFRNTDEPPPQFFQEVGEDLIITGITELNFLDFPPTLYSGLDTGVYSILEVLYSDAIGPVPGQPDPPGFFTDGQGWPEFP